MSSDAPLVTAARAGEVEAVRRLIAAGEPVNPPAGEPSALWVACVSDAADADRIAVAALLLDAGASTRSEDAPPLHAAAERGPLALVELLIRRGAVEWIPDRAGRRPLDAARASMAPDRDAIVELLDRPVLRDPPFRAAVAAIQSGDVATLERLLDARPRAAARARHGASLLPRERARAVLVWNGTPLDWAIHERREEARKRLEIA
jgi:hypothetical protein